MTTETQVSRWTGWVVFAGVMLLIAGAFDVIYGLFAIIGPNSAYFTTSEGGLIMLDIAGWGWWHLISGATLILVGIFVMQGATWARWVAVVLAAINALIQISLLPVQPWWSLIVLAVDLIVIYALIVHGRELKTAREV